MKVLVLYLFCLLSISSFALAQEQAIEKNIITEKPSEKKIIAGEKSQAVWIKTVSSDTAFLNMQLAVIKKETPQEEVDKIFEGVLRQIQEMRVELKKKGIDLEGFSINIAAPPSVTINFKFVD